MAMVLSSAEASNSFLVLWIYAAGLGAKSGFDFTVNGKRVQDSELLWSLFGSGE